MSMLENTLVGMVTPDGNVDPFDDPAPPGTPDWRPFDWEDW